MDQHGLLEIIDQLKNASKGAFEIFYGSYYPRFYWLGVRRGLSREDAEEVADDVFMRILSGLRTFDASKGNPNGWVMKVCFNAITDKLRGVGHTRGRVKWPDPDEGDGSLISEADDPEEEAERKEIWQYLRLSFEELDRDDQTEIRKGRGKRGPERTRWREAMTRWGERFRACYERVEV